MTLIKTLAGCALTLSLALPAVAQDPTPVGTWQTTSGESRFSVSYCGEGEQLCAKLTWLRKDARTPENVALLNTFVVRGAQPTAENKWRGTVTYDGHTVSGSVTLKAPDRLQVTGCQFIACKKLEFVRI